MSMEVIKTDINNLFWIKEENKKILATKNMIPGISYYKEKLYKISGVEYREWIPFKSKLAAAMLKGLEISFFNNLKKILYLGVSTGTTASHISDIISGQGIIYGVEIAPRVMLEFINRILRNRENIIPLFFDARLPSLYSDIIDYPVDLIYCDIAQPDQTRIAIINSKNFLKKNGILLYAIKARSINASREPESIYKEECDKLEREGFKIIDVINLKPYEKDHAFVYAKYMPD